MLIAFHPLDVVSVRDGKPLDIGGVVHARALWPLSPWTVLGALRTLLCEASGTAAVDYGGAWAERERLQQLEQIIGPPDGAPPFCLGPVLAVAKDGSRWRPLLPVPADVFTVTTGEKVSMHRLGALPFPPAGPDAGYARSAQHRQVLVLPRPAGIRPDKSPAVASFSRQDLDWWLAGAGQPRDGNAGREERPWCLEDLRIGIAIDSATGTVKKKHFYVRYTHALRENHCVAVTVAQPGPAAVPLRDLAGRSVRLGADGHLAVIDVDESADPWPPPAKPDPEGRASLLFLSPVRPEDIHALESRDVKVLAVVAGRPVRIGGWQLRLKDNHQVGPRPMATYHPAGTVALIRVRDEGTLASLHARSIVPEAAQGGEANRERDPRQERAAGFGFCLTGAWPQAT